MDESQVGRWERLISDPFFTLDRALSKAIALLWKTYPFASLGHGLSAHRSCRLYRNDARQITLGNNVTLMKDVWLNIVPTENKGVKIIIEDGCLIGLRNTITAKNLIHIGKDVVTADSIVFADHVRSNEDIHVPINLQGSTPGGRILIESGCWIGHCSIIVGNSGDLVIGKNSVIGANSVVTRSIPPYSVAMGNPARVVKRYDVERGMWVAGAGRASEPELAAQ